MQFNWAVTSGKLGRFAPHYFWSQWSHEVHCFKQQTQSLDVSSSTLQWRHLHRTICDWRVRSSWCSEWRILLCAPWPEKETPRARPFYIQCALVLRKSPCYRCSCTRESRRRRARILGADLALRYKQWSRIALLANKQKRTNHKKGNKYIESNNILATQVRFLGRRGLKDRIGRTIEISNERNY